MYMELISAALLWGILHVDLAHWTYCYLYTQAQLVRIQQYRQRMKRERMEEIRDSLMNDLEFVAFVADRANQTVNVRMLNAEIARYRADRRARRGLKSFSPITPVPQTTVGELLARRLLKMN